MMTRMAFLLTAVTVIPLLTAVPCFPVVENVVVPGDVMWTNTGISVSPAEDVLIVAYGRLLCNSTYPNDMNQWSDPDGRAHEEAANSAFPLVGYSRMVLMGKIGADGTPFGVGSLYHFTPRASGELYLGVNDHSGGHGDNIGAYIAFIQTPYPGTSTPFGISPSVSDLYQNAPNPFNPTTTIRFATDRGAQVSLRVYNVAGQLVRQLVGDQLPSGSHEVQWDGCDSSGNRLAAGTYFYQLQVDGEDAGTRKAVILR